MKKFTGRQIRADGSLLAEAGKSLEEGRTHQTRLPLPELERLRAKDAVRRRRHTASTEAHSPFYAPAADMR